MQLTMATGFIFTFIGSLELILISQFSKSHDDSILSILFIILSIYFIVGGLLSILLSSISFIKKDKIYRNNRMDEYIHNLSPSSGLVFGILSLAFTIFGLLIPGTLFASMGLDKGKEFRDLSNNYHGASRAKITVGKVLSIIGFVMGCTFLCFTFIYVIIFTALFLML